MQNNNGQCNVGTSCLACDKSDCDPCNDAGLTCSDCTSRGCKWSVSTSACSSDDRWWVSDWEPTCVSVATSGPLGADPKYEAQKWVFDLVNVEPVWRGDGLDSAYTGAGVQVLFNDGGVDTTHPDLNKLDLAGSCSVTDGDSGNDYHGTVCAAIAVGNAGNGACSQGIAPGASLASCNMLTKTRPYPSGFLTLGVDNAANDISSNSWGFPTCKYSSRRRLSSACPFLPDGVGGTASPCASSACSDWGSDALQSSACKNTIASYCQATFVMETDPACSDWLDLWVTCDYLALDERSRQQLQHGVTAGRAGKGVVYITSAGNSGGRGGVTNFEGRKQSRHTIAVAAVGKAGKLSSFSTQGSSVFISAPGGDNEFHTNHFVAKPNGQCADGGVGTSYACPVVSGVTALMLEARPELTWRDVQGVLAATATDKYDPDDPRWEHNAAGFHHSVKYGFGVVDAHEAVKLARNWRLWTPERSFTSSPADHNLAIPEDGTEVKATLQWPASANYILETVYVYVVLDHPCRGDLRIRLTSPHGTETELSPGPRPNCDYQPHVSWKLSAMGFWGESPVGEWKISVADRGSTRSWDPTAACGDFPGWTDSRGKTCSYYELT